MAKTWSPLGTSLLQLSARKLSWTLEGLEVKDSLVFRMFLVILLDFLLTLFFFGSEMILFFLVHGEASKFFLNACSVAFGPGLGGVL